MRVYAHCTDGLLSRKPGFPFTAMHCRAFLPLPWFSSLTSTVHKTWQILCVLYGEEGEGDFVCLFALICLNLFFALFSFDKV
jgi:hypothetical protein